MIDRVPRGIDHVPWYDASKGHIPVPVKGGFLFNGQFHRCPSVFSAQRPFSKGEGPALRTLVITGALGLCGARSILCLLCERRISKTYRVDVSLLCAGSLISVLLGAVPTRRANLAAKDSPMRGRRRNGSSTPLSAVLRLLLRRLEGRIWKHRCFEQFLVDSFQ